MTYRLLIHLLLCGCLLQCASQKDPSTTPIEGTENSPDGPGFLVGIVEFVNPDQRFVLIKTQGTANIPSGAKLTALDATGALSEVVVSPERKGSHLTADIQSGSPRAGNLVVYQPDKKSVPATSSFPAMTASPPHSPASSGPGVEWREGQPPPLEPPPGLVPLAPGESPIPPQPTSPIPLDPLAPLPPSQP